jgi:hypothetical protein
MTFPYIYKYSINIFLYSQILLIFPMLFMTWLETISQFNTLWKPQFTNPHITYMVPLAACSNCFWNIHLFSPHHDPIRKVLILYLRKLSPKSHNLYGARQDLSQANWLCIWASAKPLYPPGALSLLGALRGRIGVPVWWKVLDYPCSHQEWWETCFLRPHSKHESIKKDTVGDQGSPGMGPKAHLTLVTVYFHFGKMRCWT